VEPLQGLRLVPRRLELHQRRHAALEPELVVRHALEVGQLYLGDDDAQPLSVLHDRALDRLLLPKPHGMAFSFSTWLLMVASLQRSN